MTELSLEDITGILDDTKSTVHPTHPTEARVVEWVTSYKYPANGPIKFVTTEFRCGTMYLNAVNGEDRRCNTSTYFLLDGEPRCWVCCLRQMAELVAEIRPT